MLPFLVAESFLCRLSGSTRDQLREGCESDSERAKEIPCKPQAPSGVLQQSGQQCKKGSEKVKENFSTVFKHFG